MSNSQIQAALGCTQSKASAFAEAIRQAMRRADINTPLRAAHFFAQVGHECGSLKYMEELADGLAYEGRAALGNTIPGDGPRFKGRGLIQLTGRANYQRFSDWLQRPQIMQNPSIVAADIDLCALTAAWYWKTRALNQIADSDNIELISRRINGVNPKTGEPNGMADRRRRLGVAKQVLGVV